MPVQPLGSDYDLRGCVLSAGYKWCDILGRCIRSWEEACQIPDNCIRFSDGCNTCNVINGQVSACTEMMCFAMGIPECVLWRPDVVIDYPMPITDPVPFISNGH
tara:strand:+ start:6395 stop:6706 length:312 start_codon:yes stop_codon:yes gene_type:complete